MNAFKDILLDDDNDIMVVNGDLFVGESDEQHIGHIIKAAKGEYKQHPLCGSDSVKDLSATFNYAILNKIKLQLKADGFSNVNISYINEEIIIDAERL